MLCSQKNFLSYLIAVLTFFIFSLNAQEPMKCNGYEELCDRRYNEIAQISSHNATSNTPSPVSDQDRSIAEQLQDGIRAMKIPLHYDYTNMLAYYADLFAKYRDFVDAQIDDLVASIITGQAGDQQKLDEAIAKVNAAQLEIDATQRAIDEKKRWYDSLPDFSFSGDSKTLRAIDYAAQLGALETKKASLIAGKAMINQTLETVKSGLKLIDPNSDPRVIALRAQKALAETAANQLKNSGERVVFVCHGFPKRELYLNYSNDIINSAPENLRPLAKQILEPIQKSATELFTTFYGKSTDIGGAFPYPACLLDTGKLPLKNFLTQIKNYLDTHPHEIVSLFLNDFVHRNDDTAKAFQESGLLSYAYAHDQNKPWPTLRELITSGKRLLVFTDNDDIEPQYPWLNKTHFYFPWNTKFGFKTPEEVMRKDINVADEVDLSYKDSPPYNKFFGFSHNTTPVFAGRKSDAEKVNATPVLEYRVKRLAEGVQHFPNFISLDFYEVPNNEAMDFINHLNGVGKYKGQPFLGYIPGKTQ